MVFSPGHWDALRDAESWHHIKRWVHYRPLIGVRIEFAVSVEKIRVSNSAFDLDVANYFLPSVQILLGDSVINITSARA